ncbi:MAG TPA: hypothetical protein VHU40_09375 [Polyangia bacterium]|nr:hypothetical protein [Polyangia bacterium]
MKKTMLTMALVIPLVSASGWVVAQNVPAPKAATATTAAPAPAKPPVHVHDHGAAGAPAAAPAGEHAGHAGGMSCGMMGGGMGGGMMGGGMTGGGMMGGGMMGGGMHALMNAPNTTVEVKKLDKGVTITLTSADAATVVRLQKMAEAMRLMHEATAP